MPLNARTFAFDVLEAVEHGGFADDLLRAKSLDAQEANLANELVFGVLRHRGQLDHLISHYSGRAGKLDKEVRIALRLGIYQLRYLDRVPPHAAVSTSVDLVKRARKASAVGFVNAVLRKVNRDPITFPSDAVSLSLPDWLLAKWERQFGAPAAHAAALYFLSKPPAFLRGERQMDIGAQQIVPLLKLEPQHRFLDVCAAPGNKTLQAAECGALPVAFVALSSPGDCSRPRASPRQCQAQARRQDEASQTAQEAQGHAA